MAEEESKPTTTTSLFPLFPTPDVASASTTVSSAPQWLSNSSFTADVSLINDTVSTQFHIRPPEDDDEEQEEEDVGMRSESKYGLVESDGERRRRKKRRKKGRKEDEMDRLAARKSSGQFWFKSGSVADSASAKDYVFDSRGDRDNLAFGSLYKYGH